jgi:putative membrane protein insertion efficiency factor
MRARLLGWIRSYQRVIAHRLPAVCRFTPSCSQYTYEAIEQHGTFRGMLLGMWRIFRCSPFFRGGLDPVPPPRAGRLPASKG